MNAITEYQRRPARLAAIRRAREEWTAGVDRLVERAWDMLERLEPDLLAYPERYATAQIQEALARAVAAVGPSPAVRDHVLTAMRNQLLGASDIEAEMADPAVTEILIDGRRMRVEREGRFEDRPPLPSPAAARQLAVHLATRAGSRYQPTVPLQTVMWANGARINLVHDTVSALDLPLITIRKRYTEAALDLPDLVARGMLSEGLARFLIRAVQGRLNLCVAGPTGSGKTTFLRALARAAIPAAERVVTLEDTAELRLFEQLPHAVGLVSREGRDAGAALGMAVSLHDLFVNILRMRPDRIIVGEVRGAEAVDVLEAGVTEAGGMMLTLHLRRADELVNRFSWILQRQGIRIPRDELAAQVAAALDLVVQIDRPREADGRAQRRVVAVAEVQPDGTQRDLWVWDPAGRGWRQAAELSERRLRHIRLHASAGGGQPA